MVSKIINTEGWNLMEIKKCKVLGINSSPVLGGNVEHFLDYALREAGKEEGVITEAISLRGLKIGDCLQCNWCMKNQTTDRLCAINDDALPVLKKIRECDVLILASPVYFARLSGNMACLIDRSRCFIFGKEKPMALRGKIGIALTVGWERNGGIETTLESLHLAFLIHEMWIPSIHRAAAFFGVGAVSGPLVKGGNKLKTMDDIQTLHSASLLVKKALKFSNLELMHC